MEENWFIALHSVTTSNDLNVMSEQSVREFVEKSIVYTVEDKPAETETTTTGTAATTTATAFHDDTVTIRRYRKAAGHPKSVRLLQRNLRRQRKF